MISNIKANMEGTYHGLDGTYLQRYLDEFCYRFNRRWSLKPLILHLLECMVRAEDIPEKLRKLAESVDAW